MGTVLILKDTIAVNIINSADTHKEYVQEFPTNEFDLWIAIAICAAVFLVAIVLTKGFCSWQKAKFNHLKELEKQRNIDECAQKDKEYQREKERGELDYYRKDKEYQHEKERAEWDNAKKDCSLMESLKLICDAAKDKDGIIDKDILNLLLTNFNNERGYMSQSDKKDD